MIQHWPLIYGGLHRVYADVHVLAISSPYNKNLAMLLCECVQQVEYSYRLENASAHHLPPSITYDCTVRSAAVGRSAVRGGVGEWYAAAAGVVVCPPFGRTQSQAYIGDGRVAGVRRFVAHQMLGSAMKCGRLHSWSTGLFGSKLMECTAQILHLLGSNTLARRHRCYRRFSSRKTMLCYML